jgi:hypothetical protein
MLRVLQGARHVFVTTLSSRACRVLLVRASFVLRGLFESASCKLLNFSIARLLAYPGFELVIAFEQDLQSFRNDVGRSRVDELCVLIELCFHRLLGRVLMVESPPSPLYLLGNIEKEKR